MRRRYISRHALRLSCNSITAEWACHASRMRRQSARQMHIMITRRPVSFHFIWMCILRSRTYLQISQPLWHLQAIRTTCATILTEFSSGYAIDKDSKVQCICESCRKGFCLSLLNPRCKNSTFFSHSLAVLLYCDRHFWGWNVFCSVTWYEWGSKKLADFQFF